MIRGEHYGKEDHNRSQRTVTLRDSILKTPRGRKVRKHCIMQMFILYISWESLI